jgi:hypothetical protein
VAAHPVTASSDMPRAHWQHTLKNYAKCTIASLIVVCACALSMPVRAGSITIDSAESDVVNQMYVVNAEVAFTFSDDAIEAIKSGIALYIDVDFRISRERRYLWDPDILTLSRRYQIERHALTDRYVITDLVTDDRRTHDSLDAAIHDLGRVRGIPLAEAALLDDASEYRIELRVRLDLESLPAPLRPLAYISPSWRMSSGWYQWKITR